MAGRKQSTRNAMHLWEFLLQLLDDVKCESLINWTNKETLEFKLRNQEEVAKRWGAQKQRPGMTYDKLSRALRYYYHKGIIQKVSGQRLVYRFVDLPYTYKPKHRVTEIPPPDKRKSESRADADDETNSVSQSGNGNATMEFACTSADLTPIRVKSETVPSVGKRRTADSTSKRNKLTPAEQLIADVAKKIHLPNVIP